MVNSPTFVGRARRSEPIRSLACPALACFGMGDVGVGNSSCQGFPIAVEFRGDLES